MPELLRAYGEALHEDVPRVYAALAVASLTVVVLLGIFAGGALLSALRKGFRAIARFARRLGSPRRQRSS